MGGDERLENLLYLCLDCHRNVHRDEDYAALKGWIVWTDAAVTPVWLRRSYWVTLTPSGGTEPMTEPDALDVLRWLRPRPRHQSDALLRAVRLQNKQCGGAA